MSQFQKHHYQYLRDCKNHNQCSNDRNEIRGGYCNHAFHIGLELAYEMLGILVISCNAPRVCKYFSLNQPTLPIGIYHICSRKHLP